MKLTPRGKKVLRALKKIALNIEIIKRDGRYGRGKISVRRWRYLDRVDFALHLEMQKSAEWFA